MWDLELAAEVPLPLLWLLFAALPGRCSDGRLALEAVDGRRETLLIRGRGGARIGRRERILAMATMRTLLSLS